MIHQYKLNGYNIVLDICSGGVHVVDDVAYYIISIFEENDKDTILKLTKEQFPEISKDEILTCYNQILDLKENNELFCEDTFEPMASTLKEKTSGVVKALCLHIAHTCNLNCS